jgi:hypothetical protein
MTQISENFTLQELCKSQTAQRLRIENNPTTEHLINMVYLIDRVLQKIRDHFGIVVVSSGYRSTKLNEKIGGSENSQHSKGQAIDFEVPGVSNLAVARWIQEELEFDQLILEFYEPGDPNSGWIHLSYVEPTIAGKYNRNEVLTATAVSGKVEYSVVDLTKFEG